MAFSKQALASALEEVEKGESIRGTAKKFGIPSSTLHDHVKGKSTKVGAGAPTVLSYEEEREIVMTCIVLGDMGFGLTKDLVDTVIYMYLEENKIKNPFLGNIPGKDWWIRFKKRWPCISERKPPEQKATSCSLSRHCQWMI